MRFRALWPVLAALLFAAPAAQAKPETAHPAAAAPVRPAPVWAFETSDAPLDPAFRFGHLPNGMRYAIRHNANPAGTVLVRMEVETGSLDESEDERGFAHFIEHMAFQGSTHVPEGEMVRLLERKGLAFGADTNAVTSFQHTTYMLDLPRNDAGLIDTALMLMRETASELSFAPEQVTRERGVVLAEKRDRDTWQLRDAEARFAFFDPQARYAARLPIGTLTSLNGATPARLRAFWAAHYVPARTSVVVIGDIDAAAVEAAITAHFADWPAAPAPAHPSAGPIDPADMGRSEVFIDAALPQRVTAARHGGWVDEPDTLAQRREDMLRRIGYGVINRRLQSVARRPDAPFESAALSTADIFHAGITTTLTIDCRDGLWQPAVTSAVAEYRRALAQGFTAAELAEQLANLRTALEHQVAEADTRGSGALLNEVFSLLRDRVVPTTPQSVLDRFNAFAPEVTPDMVLAALSREALPLEAPLLRYTARTPLPGGAPALRKVWDSAWAAAAGVAAEAPKAMAHFAYDSFGTPGTVVADAREPLLGIRRLRFANGVRLNLKHTAIDKDRVLVSVNIDGGKMLATRAAPLSVEMMPVIAAGGLGRHSQDELQSLLAGHVVGASWQNSPETFTSAAQTTPADLGLELRLIAAFVTDPGYRREGEQQYAEVVKRYFAQMRATPGAALNAAIGGLIADNDPRFTTQPRAAYAAQTFARLKAAVADRLAHGAIEIGIVGDIDEDRVVALVSSSFGALPAREPEFLPYPEQRDHPFSADHRLRVLHHTGPADQALVHVVWLTRDYRDPVEKQALNLLDRVMRIALLDELRQKLGKTYSPGAASETSRVWRNFGLFHVSASVDVKDVAAVDAAIAETVARLRDAPVSADLLQRAREPLLLELTNELKANTTWLGLAAHAASQPDGIERQVKARERLLAVTAADVQAVAQHYLVPTRAVPIHVLPAAPAPAPAKP